MSFTRNAVSLMATSAVVMPLGLLTNVVLARLLGAELLGGYSVLVNFATIGVLLSALGWPSATIYRIRREGIASPVVVATGLAAMGAISLAVFTVGLLAEELVLEHLLQGATPSAYRIGLALIPVQLYGRLFVALARGMDRFELANRYRIVLATGTVLALLIVLGTGDATLVEAIGALFSVYLISVIGLGIAVIKATGFARLASFSEALATLRYGIKSYAQSIAGQVHEQVDVLMLAAFSVDPAEIAFYAIAVGVVNRLKIIPESISAALFPHVAGIDPHDASLFAARATRHAVAWVWLSALAVGLAAPLIVPLVFGEVFVSSVVPILILLPGVAMLTTYSVLARYFMAVNKQGTTVRTQTVSTVLNIGLNVFLIPRMGILGAALSSLISYGVEMLLIVLAFRVDSGVPLCDTLIVKNADLMEYRARLASMRAGPG